MFAHGQQELRTQPDLMKTTLCIQWQKSCCPLGASECRFAHSEDDLRFVEEEAPAPRTSGARSKEPRPPDTAAPLQLALGAPPGEPPPSQDRVPIPARLVRGPSGWIEL